MEPGDVIVVLQQEPHNVFQRSGDNLVMKHKINLVESLCGFQLVITHLDGRKIVLQHPPNDPIAPGNLFPIKKIIWNFIYVLETYRCVKGQGMINMRTHDAGDLIIQFDVEFPAEKSLTDPHVLKVHLNISLMFEFFLFLRNLNQFYLNVHMWIYQKVKMLKKLI
jgi:DnaJ family protein A protein 2